MQRTTCINMHVKYLHVSWISFHLQTLLKKLSGYKPHTFNLSKPISHMMHHKFNIQQLYIPPTLYWYVLYLCEKKQRSLLHIA
jgi:hypothetical protein